MVLKAQLFASDAVIAFIVIMMTATAFTAKNADILQNVVGNYEAFSLQARLLQASDVLVATSDKGFAKHEDNTVKHHEIDVAKVRLEKNRLLLDGYDACLTVRSASFNYGNCSHYDNKVIRFAECGGEVCKIELSARLSSRQTR
ncbi:MAG: hypothetical protein QXO69_01730 [archaeon]